MWPTAVSASALERPATVLTKVGGGADGGEGDGGGGEGDGGGGEGDGGALGGGGDGDGGGGAGDGDGGGVDGGGGDGDGGRGDGDGGDHGSEQKREPFAKPGRLGRLKSDQPSSQLTLPNAPLYVAALKKVSPFGTGSTFEYAAEPHAGRGSIGTMLVSVNVPPEMSGLSSTKVGAVPVHGDTIWKPAVGLWMMLFDEKNR
jgi:hypothetical protein